MSELQELQDELELLDLNNQLLELEYGNMLLEEEYSALEEPSERLDPTLSEMSMVGRGKEFEGTRERLTEEELDVYSLYGEKGKEITSQYMWPQISAARVAEGDFARMEGETKPERTKLGALRSYWDMITREGIGNYRRKAKGMTEEEREGQKYFLRMVELEAEKERKIKQKAAEKKVGPFKPDITTPMGTSAMLYLQELEGAMDEKEEKTFKESLSDLWTAAKEIPWSDVGEELFFGSLEDAPLWIAGFGGLRKFKKAVELAKKTKEWKKIYQGFTKAERSNLQNILKSGNPKAAKHLTRVLEKTGLGEEGVKYVAKTGKAAKAAQAALEPLSRVPPGIQAMAGFTAEVGVFLTAEAISSGELPTPGEVIATGAFVGTLKAAQKAYQKAQKIFRKYKEKPEAARPFREEPVEPEPPSFFKEEGVKPEPEPTVKGLPGEKPLQITTEGFEKRTFTDIVKDKKSVKLTEKYPDVKTTLDKIAKKRYSKDVEVALTDKETGIVIKGRKALNEAGYSHLPEKDAEGNLKEYAAGARIVVTSDGKRKILVSDKSLAGTAANLDHEVTHAYYDYLKNPGEAGLTVAEEELLQSIKAYENDVITEGQGLGYDVPEGVELFPTAYQFQTSGATEGNEDLASLVLIPEKLVENWGALTGLERESVLPETIQIRRTERKETTPAEREMRGKEIEEIKEPDIIPVEQWEDANVETLEGELAKVRDWLGEQTEAAEALGVDITEYKGPERRVPIKEKIQKEKAEKPYKLGSLKDTEKVREYLESVGESSSPTAIREFIKSGRKVPEKKKRIGKSVAERAERTHEKRIVDSLLRGGDEDAHVWPILASELPKTFEVEGIKFRRVKTKEPGVVKVKTLDKPDEYRFNLDDQVFINPESIKEWYSLEGKQEQEYLDIMKNQKDMFESGKSGAQMALNKIKAMRRQKLKAKDKGTEDLPLFEGQKKPTAKQQTMFSLEEKKKVEKSPAFRKWFGKSKVRDEKGKPLVVYRGDFDVSKIDILKGMPAEEGHSGAVYFTSDPEVASGYAEGKTYIEEGYDDPKFFSYTYKKKTYNLLDKNVKIDAATKKKINNILKDEFGVPQYRIDSDLKEAGNNVVYGAYKSLVESGAVYPANDFPEDFLNKVFEKSLYKDPTYGKKGVTPVYLSIKKPWNVTSPRATDLHKLKKMLPESDLTLQDLIKKETVVYVTPASKTALQKLGYDGIEDPTGGGITKGKRHSVYIAFEPTQIKSAIGNIGTYDPKKADIRYSLEEKKPGKKRFKLPTFETRKQKVPPAARELIKQWSTNKQLHEFRSQRYVNWIQRSIPKKAERELIPFLIEKTAVPEKLKRKDLEEAFKSQEVRKRLQPISDKVREHFHKGWKYMQDRLPDMSASEIENYVTHVWKVPKKGLKDAVTWFATRNPLLKKRFLKTYAAGIEKGYEPRTLDIAEIINIHDQYVIKTTENVVLVDGLNKLQSEQGMKLIQRADKAPEGWMMTDHPVLRRALMIPGKTQERAPDLFNLAGTFEKTPDKIIKMPVKYHPDMDPVIQAAFGKRIKMEGFAGTMQWFYETANAILKKSNLSFSFFHHGALTETGVATLGPVETAKIIFNMKKLWAGIKHNKWDFYDVPEVRKIVEDGIKHGLQWGALTDVHRNMIVKILEGMEGSLSKIHKNLGLPVKGVRKFNDLWDAALWDYLHNSLKVYGYETISSRMLAGLKNPTSEMITKAKEEAAQFVNDTFGGQNWERMMTNPKTLQVFQWLLLSPDWTLSTMRQAVSPIGLGVVHKEMRKGRAKQGLLFWARVFAYFGAGLNGLNWALTKRDDMEQRGVTWKQAEGKFLWENDPGHKTHLFQGRYPDGSKKYLRFGKQFREFPELIYDQQAGEISPVTATLHKIGGKTSPNIQNISKIFTGSSPSGFKDYKLEHETGWAWVGAATKEILSSPMPFSWPQTWEEVKEFRPQDLAFPKSRGMTYFKTKKLFKRAIIEKNQKYIRSIFKAAVENNLDAFDILKTSITELKSEASSQLTRKIRKDPKLHALLEAETAAEQEKILSGLSNAEKKALARGVQREAKKRAILNGWERYVLYADSLYLGFHKYKSEMEKIEEENEERLDTLQILY